MTLLEYMRENPDSYADFSFNCKGKVTEGNYTISCYNKKAHGAGGFDKGLCRNPVIQPLPPLACALDESAFKSTCEELLFNTELPSPLTYSKSSFSLKTDATPAEQMMTAIGQGETLVSPLHMALIAGTIANDGVLMKPYLLEEVRSAKGATVKTFDTEEYGSLMTADEAAALTEYMKGPWWRAEQEAS